MPFRKYLITGLLVWLPMVITVWVLVWLVNLIDGIFGGVLTGLVKRIEPRAQTARVSDMETMQAVRDDGRYLEVM